MNPLVKIVLGAGAVIGIAVFAINYHSTTRTESEYRLAKESIRAEYLERAGAVRSTPDAAAYEDEVRGLLKWYFGELADLYNRYPTFRGADEAYLRQLDEARANGKVKAEEYDQKKANFQQVKEFYDLMKSGKYEPTMTAGDSSLRLDFLDFEPSIVDGQKGVKARFVLWGAQRRRTAEKGPGGQVVKRVDVPVEWGSVHFGPAKPKDEKVVAKKDPKKEATSWEFEVGIPAGPYVPHPERQIEDFPPMAYLGTFAFPLLPYEATSADVELILKSRSGTGRDIEAKYAWTKEIPAEWRLKEGEKWEGAIEEEREELGEAGR